VSDIADGVSKVESFLKYIDGLQKQTGFDKFIDDVTIVGAGLVEVSGSVSAQTEDVVVLAQGAVVVSGAAILLLEDVSILSSGTTGGDISGVLAVILASVTLICSGTIGVEEAVIAPPAVVNQVYRVYTAAGAPASDVTEYDDRKHTHGVIFGHWEKD